MQISSHEMSEFTQRSLHDNSKSIPALLSPHPRVRKGCHGVYYAGIGIVTRDRRYPICYACNQAPADSGTHRHSQPSGSSLGTGSKWLVHWASPDISSNCSFLRTRSWDSFCSPCSAGHAAWTDLGSLLLPGLLLAFISCRMVGQLAGRLVHVLRLNPRLRTHLASLDPGICGRDRLPGRCVEAVSSHSG